MKKIALLLIVSLSFLVGSEFIDDDMDGVEDRYDKCPNSLLTDIVDQNGCVVQKLIYPKEHHGDVTIGYGYTKLDDNNSQTSLSLSFGYNYGNFGAYFYTSNYELDTSQSGVDDSILELNYKFYDKKRVYTLSSGIYLPTYDTSGNNLDYFLRFSSSYFLEKVDFSLSLQHTFMKDDFTDDTDRFSISTGYTITDKLYGSLTYSTQNSIYKEESDLNSLSIYTNYEINKNFFLSLSASKGLSKSASEMGLYLNLGYMF